MQKIIFSLSVILLIQFSSQKTGFKAKVYKINLDLPPLERWKNVTNDFKPQLQAFIKYLKQKQKIPEVFYKLIDKISKYYHDQEFIEEIRSIFEILGENPGFGIVYNFMYEWYAYCTSIVIQQEDGTVFHGRNLDYQLFLDFGENISAEGHFYKNNTLIYKAPITAGFTGFHTAVKQNEDKGFAISMNERNQGGILNLIYEILFRKTYTIPYTIRKVLENANDYEEALEYLKTKEITADCYLILSGTRNNQGAVVTRSARESDNVLELDSQKDLWYLVQTNYDRDVPDPQEDYRRVPAEKKILKIGQQRINIQNLYQDVLIKKPNFEVNNSTIMTVMMQASTGYFNITLWK